MTIEPINQAGCRIATHRTLAQSPPQSRLGLSALSMTEKTHGNADRLLRRSEAEVRTGLTRSSIYRLIDAGDFPRQRRLSPSTVGWLESEISNWISGRAVL
jgi:prophage regulatory protein